jgi:hypothetical protein
VCVCVCVGGVLFLFPHSIPFHSIPPSPPSTPHQTESRTRPGCTGAALRARDAGSPQRRRAGPAERGPASALKSRKDRARGTRGAEGSRGETRGAAGLARGSGKAARSRRPRPRAPHGVPVAEPLARGAAGRTRGGERGGGKAVLAHSFFPPQLCSAGRGARGGAAAAGGEGGGARAGRAPALGAQNVRKKTTHTRAPDRGGVVDEGDIVRERDRENENSGSESAGRRSELTPGGARRSAGGSRLRGPRPPASRRPRAPPRRPPS